MYRVLPEVVVELYYYFSSRTAIEITHTHTLEYEKRVIYCTFAEACDDCQPRRIGAPRLAHEEDQVFVPGFAKRGHFFSEGLQRGFIVHILHVEQLHRHVPMPAAFVYYNNKNDIKYFSI